MSRPTPLAPVDDIPAARDIPFAGTMTLAVDATDLARGIYRVRQTVPVQAALGNGGRMTMLYPEWLPGNHAPRGPIASIAGLTVTANGQPIRWSRNGRLFTQAADDPLLREAGACIARLHSFDDLHGATGYSPARLTSVTLDLGARR